MASHAHHHGSVVDNGANLGVETAITPSRLINLAIIRCASWQQPVDRWGWHVGTLWPGTVGGELYGRWMDRWHRDMTPTDFSPVGNRNRRHQHGNRNRNFATRPPLSSSAPTRSLNAMGIMCRHEIAKTPTCTGILPSIFAADSPRSKQRNK